jgi:hypothetical protein
MIGNFDHHPCPGWRADNPVFANMANGPSLGFQAFFVKDSAQLHAVELDHDQQHVDQAILVKSLGDLPGHILDLGLCDDSKNFEYEESWPRAWSAPYRGDRSIIHGFGFNMGSVLDAEVLMNSQSERGLLSTFLPGEGSN